MYMSGLIVVHHFYKHKNDKMSWANKVFQLSDVCNHETWALFFVGISIGSYMQLNYKNNKQKSKNDD